MNVQHRLDVGLDLSNEQHQTNSEPPKWAGALLLWGIPIVLQKIHLFRLTSCLLQDGVPWQRLSCDSIAERRVVAGSESGRSGTRAPDRRFNEVDLCARDGAGNLLDAVSIEPEGFTGSSFAPHGVEGRGVGTC